RGLGRKAARVEQALHDGRVVLLLVVERLGPEACGRMRVARVEGDLDVYGGGRHRTHVTVYSSYMPMESTGLEMLRRWGNPFHFDPGAAVLEFAYTGGVGTWAVYETLHHPRDLTAWLAGPPVHVKLSRAATEEDLFAARELRDAINHAARALA